MRSRPGVMGPRGCGEVADPMQDDARQDDFFDHFINIPLIRAGRKLQLAFFKDAVQPAGLSIQEWRTLLALARLEDTHLRELARQGRLDATHVGRAAAGLEKKGLVALYDDPDDHRRRRVKMTEAGHGMIARIWPKARALDAKIRAELGDEAFADLRKSLVAILDMEELEPEGDVKVIAAPYSAA